MKRYPNYKDSGIDWLGEIPEHWQRSSIRGVTRSVAQRNRPDLPLLAVYRDYGVIYRDSRDDNHNTIPQDLSNYKVVKPGNLVLNKMKTWQGSLGVSEFEGIVSPAYIICEVSTDVHSGFLHYLLRCYRYIFIYNKISYGVRVDQWDMHYEDFKQIPIFLPSLSEQKAIAHFLDHKLEQIEQYIRNKQRLIELLNEQKTAIINRAVTKGINPNVPMKHSGIEWLGEIPAHWQLVKLGNLCWKVADGPHFSPSYLDEGIMFLSARNVKVDSWSLEDIKYISQKDYKEFCKRIIPETGDILYTKGGTTGIARVVDLEEPFQVWVHIAVLKLKKEKINPYLLAYILNGNACYQQSQLYTRGATNQDLGLTRMVNIVFAIPPSLEEQQYIVDYLKNEISKIALAIAQIEKEIELIQEYRTTLISDAVTGKIDVRGFDNGSNSKNSPKPPELATM